MANITGFGAQPLKPDFAFPKTVSSNADKQLTASLQAGNGPATVRALLDWGLAQTAISADNTNKVSERMARIQQQVSAPGTKAMIELARAGVIQSDSLRIAAINKWTPQLRETPLRDWRQVVKADERFTPTLYDFAVQLLRNSRSAQVDSIVNAATEWNEKRVYPCFYLQNLRTHNHNELLALYKRYAGSDVSAYVLARMAAASYDLKRREEVYSLCRQWVAMHPSSSLKNEVIKAERYLTRPSATIESQSIVAPGHTVKVQVKTVCLNACDVQVTMLKPAQKKILTIPLKFEGSGVFAADTTLYIPLSQYGTYEIVPVFAGQDIERGTQPTKTTVVTSFMLSSKSFGGKSDVMALDAINGALQSDVTFTHPRKNVTGGVRGNDQYTPDIYSYNYHEDSDTTWNRSANILTDRGIYHPGDTVRFMATVMEARKQQRRVAAGKQIEAILHNVNYEEKAKLTLTTDDYGRIKGEFPLPDEGLTGHYHIELKNTGSQFFLVSDYKAPTFEPEVNSTRIDSTTVELNGNAKAYSGFAIADARVTVALRRLPDWVWYRNYRNSGGSIVATDTVTTDAEGKFTTRLTIPAKGNFECVATITSAAGESHDAHCFIASHRYFISADIPAFVLAGSGPKFSVFDSKGDATDIKPDVLLKSGSETITPNPDWSNVPSGCYSLTAATADADTLRRSDVMVYRRDDKNPPAQLSLFVPVTKAQPGDELLVGTSYADSHILYTLWTPDSIIEQKWIAPASGNFKLPVDLPKGVESATLTLTTLRNYKSQTSNISITRPDRRTNLALKVESMRNRMTPGETETWTIKVTDNLGRPAQSALVLDVYSKALDALAPLSWQFNAPQLYGRSFGQQFVQSRTSYRRADKNIDQPQGLKADRARFNLYGRYWPNERVFYYADTERPMLRVSGSRAVNTMAMYDAAAPAPAVAELKMARMESSAKEDADAVEEAVSADAENEEAFGSTTDAGGTNANVATDSYRLPEVPVALWRPVITTGTDGETRIEFTAPNANTTWQVKALAYDRALLSGIFSAEIVTSKPVMVQPQLPRFMRAGDTIEFRSMVMNNSDTTRSVESFIEIFNPLTDEIIHKEAFTQVIDSARSAVIATTYTAPNESMVGVRVRATSGNFTDGEQTVIAILPAEVAVRTGRPFFLPSDSLSTEMEVPRGGVMTVTANAVWECVTALPGLQTSESKSALSLASSLFSSATARGLLRSHPAIGRAITAWQNEEGALVGRLDKNPDLKIALLSSTPWVGTAQTINERMARLDMLFNRKLIEQTINDDINNLSRLVKNGGFAWTSQCDEPSEWITMCVLRTVSQLRRMGYAPESRKLDNMVDAAVKYIDNEVAKDFAKHPKSTFMQYVWLRSQFPATRMPSGAQRAKNYTVQQIVANWRDYGINELPMAAIVLFENGYQSTSRLIIESLRQREAWRQTWLNPLMLEAFSRIEPDCAEVEIIRNYFIEQKQSTSWGDGLNTSNLIASILNSGADWLVPAENSLEVKVNGVKVKPDAISRLGEFRLDLPQGGKVEIDKGQFPAWGGVFSASTDSITSVKPFASEKLKITRTVSGEMKVGNKVTITLTIEAAQPIDFVLVTQPRCAAFEPVDQLPSTLFSWLGSIYREPCPTVTNWFINRLLKGKTEISETFYVTAEGRFILAPAEAQSQLAPEFQAHSSGMTVDVTE